MSFKENLMRLQSEQILAEKRLSNIPNIIQDGGICKVEIAEEIEDTKPCVLRQKSVRSRSGSRKRNARDFLDQNVSNDGSAVEMSIWTLSDTRSRLHLDLAARTPNKQTETSGSCSSTLIVIVVSVLIVTIVGIILFLNTH